MVTSCFLPFYPSSLKTQNTKINCWRYHHFIPKIMVICCTKFGVELMTVSIYTDISKKHEKIFFSKKLFIQALNFPNVYWSMLHKAWNQIFAKIWVKRPVLMQKNYFLLLHSKISGKTFLIVTAYRIWYLGRDIMQRFYKV